MNAPPRLRPSAIAVLTLVGCALRAFHANAQSLWFDEIGSARIATMPMAALIDAVEQRTVEPTAWLSTAYYAVVRTVLLLPHGSPDALLRSTSVALGTATIPAFAWTASALLSADAALAATTFLAFSPFHVWYSQEVRPYALLVLITTLLMGAYLRALATGAARWWIMVAVFTTLALYTHPIALALPVIVGVGILATAARDVRRLVPGTMALAAAGAAFLPMVVWIGGHGANHPADPRPVGWLDLPYALYAYAVGFSLGPSTSELHAGTLTPVLPHLPTIAFAALVFGTLAIRGALAARGLAPTLRTVLLAWLVLPLTVAFVVAVESANPFNVRYAIVAFPAFVLLLGAGAANRNGAWIGALAVALSLVSLGHLYFDPRYAKEDARGLAAMLGTEASAGDLVMVNAAYMASAVTYYYPGPAEVVGYPPEPAREVSPAAAAEAVTMAAGHPHVWLVLSRTFHGDAAGVLGETFARRFTFERERRFDGIVARRFSTR